MGHGVHTGNLPVQNQQPHQQNPSANTEQKAMFLHQNHHTTKVCHYCLLALQIKNAFVHLRLQ